MSKPSLDRFGRYHLTSRLFSDEMAEGYQAAYRTPEGERSVILKIFRDSICKSELFRQLYEENVELGKLVDHRNVVRIVDSGHIGANLYIACDYHSGRTLRQLLHALHQQHVILPPEYAAYIALQICEALEHLHGFKDPQGRSVRIVHNDVCPGTILLGFDGVVRVLDGGMVRARNMGEPELAAASVGRPGYFGPERIKGSRPTPRSDVYALGVVLWELLTGRRLFAGDDREEIMAEVLIAEIESPRDFNAEISEELEQVVMKAIDRRVLRRYATASVFKNALRAYLADSKDRSLRAGLAGVMDTLFGEEREQADITGHLPKMDDRVTGRLGDFAEKHDTRPGPGHTDTGVSEPWVKRHSDGPGRGPILALLLVALLALGSAGWYVMTNDDDGPPVIADGLELVEELQKKYPDASDPDGLRAAEGWIALSEGTPEAIARSRKEMEVAVAADPWNASAVAGLALVYAHLGGDEPSLNIAAVELLSRAQKLDQGEESLLRAEAGVALAAGNHERAVEKAKVCTRNQRDGLCEWYKGEGLLALGDYKAAKDALAVAKEALPLAPGLQRSFGEAAMLDGDYQAAMDALESAVRRLPDEADVHMTMAKLHRHTGRFDEALLALDRVLELEPRHQEARYLKGLILLYVRHEPLSASELLAGLAEDPSVTKESLARRAAVQAAFATLEAERPAEAMRYADMALEISDVDPQARLAKALALDATGAEDAAEDALSTKNANLTGRSAALYHYHAALIYSGHDHQRFARLSLESAAAADPNWVPPQLALALVEEQMGDAGISRLVGTWRMDLELEPGRDPIVTAPLATLDPLDIWAQVAEREPDDFDTPGMESLVAGILQAHACLPDGDCVEAREALESAHAVAPNTATRVFLAQVRMRQGEHESALVLIDDALKGEPNSAVLHSIRASCLASLGQHDDAVAAFTKAEGAPGATAAVFRNHALLLSERKEHEAAERLARKALSLDDDDIIASGLLLR